MNNRRTKLTIACVAMLTIAGWAAQGNHNLVAASGTTKPLAAPDAPASPDIAAIPTAFSYQGTLRLADGNLATGSYNITLRIYSVVTGGSALHTETFNNTVVRNGSFSVVVGDASPIGPTVFDNANLYLGITVAPDPEMLPRQRLFPVPWAMQAGAAQTAVTAQTANTLATNATGNGLTLSRGAVNDPGITLNSSSLGWGSGIRFANTAGNVTWGIYAGSDGHFHMDNVGGNQAGLTFENGGDVVVHRNMRTKAINVDGRVTATSFNGWCGIYPGGQVTNAVFCNQDVAETFATNSRIEPGSLVVFIPEERGVAAVRPSGKPYESTIVGVVSTNPGLVFDQGKTYLAGQNDKLITDKKTVVAMIGRVPTKFSLENGPIAIGDPLTSGSTPGTAMKATQAGQIIGYAMQSSAVAKDGKILVWLQPGTYIPQDTLAALNALTALEARK